MEAVSSNEGEYEVVPESLHNPQYLVAEADAVQESQDEADLNESEEDSEKIRDQDRFLPIANVAKIMKNSIPENAKIAKDAKECVQECVSEFVSFITSEASDRCQQEKRKTINGEDLLVAMSTLGFDSYVEPLKTFLSLYRASIKAELKPGEKLGIRRRELYDDDEERLVAMETSTESVGTVGGTVAAFVTTGGQNISIIPAPVSGSQELVPQQQIYTAAFPAPPDIVQFQS